MAGGEYRLQGPAVALDQLAVGDAHVRLEGHVAAFWSGKGPIAARADAMRTIAIGRRVAPLLHQLHARRVIAVGVCHDDVSDLLILQHLAQPIRMRFLRRTRIDHRYLAMADDIGVGAARRERAGIGARDPAQVRGQGDDLAWFVRKLFVERDDSHRGGGSCKRLRDTPETGMSGWRCQGFRIAGALLM